VHAVDYTPLPPTRRKEFFGPSSLLFQVIFAWWRMRASTRRIITNRYSEEYLFGMLMLSNFAFFFAWTLRAVLVPGKENLAIFSTEVGVVFVTAFIGRTCAMYFLALVLGALCRTVGGRGTWRNTRAAVFWAMLVVAPFGMIAALVTVLVEQLGVFYPILDTGWIRFTPYWIVILPSTWYLSLALAQAHGFRKSAPVFLYSTIGALVSLVLAMYFGANGVF
jgi:hypothetical protein